MATWNAVNVLSGTTELPKYNAFDHVEQWKVTLTTALASGNTIVGPTLPAGCYLSNVKIDTGSLDSGAGMVIEAGYTGALAAFIATSTIGQGGGIQSANVAGTLGFSATTNTQIPSPPRTLRRLPCRASW